MNDKVNWEMVVKDFYGYIASQVVVPTFYRTAAGLEEKKFSATELASIIGEKIAKHTQKTSPIRRRRKPKRIRAT